MATVFRVRPYHACKILSSFRNRKRGLPWKPSSEKRREEARVALRALPSLMLRHLRFTISFNKKE